MYSLHCHFFVLAYNPIEEEARCTQSQREYQTRLKCLDESVFETPKIFM